MISSDKEPHRQPYLSLVLLKKSTMFFNENKFSSKHLMPKNNLLNPTCFSNIGSGSHRPQISHKGYIKVKMSKLIFKKEKKDSNVTKE